MWLLQHLNIRRWLVTHLLPRTWQLRIWLRRVNREYGPKVEGAKRQKDKAKLHELYEEWHFESTLLSDELNHIAAERLIKQARRWNLPVPELPRGKPGTLKDVQNESWYFEPSSGFWVLKPKGFTALWSAIRTERRERIHTRLAIITAIAGLLGVLTGLVAVWKIL